MNKHLLSIALVALLLSGCRKVLFSPERRLEGQWRLYKAERIGFLNRNNLDTEYKSGVFTFRNDGSAIYNDGSVVMNGNWQMRLDQDRSFNNNGDESTRNRTRFTLNLYNFNANRILNLDFDDCNFNLRNRFIAEYNTVTYRYRYEFRRE